jgi:membrane-associated phospholipid phosphatase
MSGDSSKEQTLRVRTFFALDRREGRWIFGCLVCLVLLSADVLTGGPLNHLDHAVRDAVQQRSPHPPAWLGPPSNLGEIGTATAFMLVAALVTSQVIWRAWPVVLAVANLAVVEAAVLLLKTVIGRPGPGTRARLGGYPGYFPSGHTATSAVCVGTVGFLVAICWGSVRRLGTASTAGQLAGLAGGVVSAVDAVLGDFHWLTDAVGGLLVSSVVLTIGFGAARGHVHRTYRPSRLDPP